MSALTFAQVYALAKGAGLSPAAAVIATAIAMAESGLNPDAVGDVGLENATWGPSVGLWQIRSLRAQTGTGQSRDVNRLKDPTFNAAAMAQISGMGKSFKPWSTYTSGSYRKYLASATSAGSGSAATPTTPSPLSSGTTTPGSTTTAQDAGLLSNLNPFKNWQTDVANLGLKLTVTLLASALAVAGVVRLVAPSVEKAVGDAAKVAPLAAMAAV